MCLWIVEEVGPVWVSLHVPELKQLSEAQCQDVLTDLRQKQTRGREESRDLWEEMKGEGRKWGKSGNRWVRLGNISILYRHRYMRLDII